MGRLAKWLAIGLVLAAGLAVAALAAVPYLVDAPRIQALIAGAVGQALGRPVRFSDVSVSVFPLPAVVLEDLQVAEDPAFGQVPFLRVGRAEMRFRLWPLLLLRAEPGDFVLKEPRISLVQRADGRWNVSTLGSAPEPRGAGRPRGGAGGGAAAGAVLGSRVKIAGGVVSYETRVGGAATRYQVKDLDLTLAGGRGPLAFEGDATVEPGGLDVKITDGTLGFNGARSLQEARVRARVTLDGRNVRDLVAFALGPEPSVTGAVAGTLSVEGTVGDPRASGELQVKGLAVSQVSPRCPEPRRRRLDLGTVKLEAAWADSRLTARPVSAALGGGTITATVTVRLEDGARIEVADLGIHRLPVEKVLVDFLCQAYAVTGPLDLTGRASARAGDLWRTLDGQGRVRVGPGKVVGSQALSLLASVLRAGSAASSLLRGEVPVPGPGSALDYDSISATYTVAGGVLTTRDLVFTAPAFRMRAAGTYALASGALNLDVVLQQGRAELRARVTGTAASPSISLAPESLTRGLDRERMERGLQDLLRRFR